MNNKQLGRKFATENINVTAAREAISLVEGFSATKLVNASDAEVVGLFESLSRNMKEEVVSEMVENYNNISYKLEKEANSFKKGQIVLKSTSASMLLEILNSFLVNKNIDSNIITINAYNKFNEFYPIEIIKGKNELLYRIKLSDNDHTYWVSLKSKDEIVEMLRRNSY